jgi:hypothetical protein
MHNRAREEVSLLEKEKVRELMFMRREVWEVVKLSLEVRRDCLTVYLECVWEEQGTRPRGVFRVANGVSLLRMK